MEPEPLQGFPPPQAALNLLRVLGHEVQQDHLRECLQRGRGHFEELLQLLESHGFRGRLVQVEVEELGLLDLPTLLQLKDESWILLHQAKKDRWIFEDASGMRLGTPLRYAFSGTALDRLGTLHECASLWQQVGRLVLDHRGALTQVLVVSIFMQCLAMVSPLIIRIVMDQALPQASRSLLVLAVLGLLLSSLASSGLGLVRDWTSAFVETRLDAITQRGLLDHTLRLPFKHLMRHTVGDLMQAFIGLSTAKDLLTQRLFGTAMDAVTMIGYMVLMVNLWPMGAGLVLAGGCLLAALSVGPALLQARIQQKAMPIQILERDAMVQMLQGIATIKSAGVESRVLERWSNRFMKTQELGLRRQRLGLWSEVGLDAVGQLLTATLLVEGGRRVLTGELSIGSLFAFQQMAVSLTGAFQGATSLAIGFIVARPQLEKAEEILSLEPEPLPPALPTPHTLDLAVEKVWFRYNPEDAWVLKGLNLKVTAGARHWLRWPSGAGKSTLLRLLAGLLEPERGRVMLGGRPVRELREEVVYMPQDFHLYGASILENLRILSGRAPLERLVAAAETSGLSRLVATLPMGYETLLSPGGSNVSGGQRQLVLLTAAIATERRILLLDEVFANLDWISRSEILHGDWFHGKTVIYASHDAGLTEE